MKNDIISYQIFVDGSCRANGNGGVGIVWLKNGEKVYEYSIGVITKPWNPKKNIELITKIKKQLLETQKLVKNPITFRHTRGHQKIDSEDARWNNQCDWLAQTSSINLL